MSWSSVGSIIVGTAWQYSTPYLAQEQNYLRVIPGAGSYPGFPCLIALRRTVDQSLYGVTALFIENGQSQVVRIEPLEEKMVVGNLQIAMKLYRSSRLPVACSLAYWVN